MRSCAALLTSLVSVFDNLVTFGARSRVRQLASRLLAGALVILFAAPLCRAQIINVTDDQSAPIPGVGHNYIHMLSETVDPANGSVSVHINIPVPKSRGFTLPFGFVYNSNGVTYPSGNVNGSQEWFHNLGGWANTLPGLNAQKLSYFDSSGNECDYWTDFMFTDPSGGGHALGLLVWDTNYPSNCQNTAGAPTQYLTGGDSQYQAQGGTSTSQLFADVADANGTVYEFNNVYLPALVPELPVKVVGRDGNNVETFPSGGVTDTSGRQVLTFGSSGGAETVTVSGQSTP